MTKTRVTKSPLTKKIAPVLAFLVFAGLAVTMRGQDV